MLAKFMSGSPSSSSLAQASASSSARFPRPFEAGAPGEKATSLRESERRRRLPGDVGVCEEMEFLERWEATDWRRGDGAGEMDMERAEGRRECVGVWGVDGMVRASVYVVPRRHGESGTTQRLSR
jgi:hypothetical protein